MSQPELLKTPIAEQYKLDGTLPPGVKVHPQEEKLWVK